MPIHTFIKDFLQRFATAAIIEDVSKVVVRERTAAFGFCTEYTAVLLYSTTRTYVMSS